jgi:hypothetical protein
MVKSGWPAWSRPLRSALRGRGARLGRGAGRLPGRRRSLMDALTFADMTTGPAGQPMTLDERIGEIRRRYPPDDPVHRAIGRARPLLQAAIDRTRRCARSTRSRTHSRRSACGGVGRAAASNPARRADLARGGLRRLPVREASGRADLMAGRPPPRNRVSNRTRTSTARCATAGRRARDPEPQGGAEHAATGTPSGRPPRARLEPQPPAPP